MDRTAIPVDFTTKERLERHKRATETRDEFLERLLRAEEPIQAGVWSDEEAAWAKTAIRESRRSGDCC